jgi:hypothetical protein
MYTTGRGGSGNMTKNNDPEVARRAQDVVGYVCFFPYIFLINFSSYFLLLYHFPIGDIWISLHLHTQPDSNQKKLYLNWKWKRNLR